MTGDSTKPETITAALADADKLFVVSNGINVAELEGNVYAAARGSCVRHIVKISGLDRSRWGVVRLPVGEGRDAPTDPADGAEAARAPDRLPGGLTSRIRPSVVLTSELSRSPAAQAFTRICFVV